MIFSKNAIWFGLLVGLAIPFVGYAVLLTIFDQLDAIGWVSAEGFSSTFRVRTLSVIAICLNTIPLNIFNKRRMTESMRGIVFPTAAYVIVWIIYFGRYIF